MNFKLYESKQVIPTEFAPGQSHGQGHCHSGDSVNYHGDSQTIIYSACLWLVQIPSSLQCAFCSSSNKKVASHELLIITQLLSSKFGHLIMRWKRRNFTAPYCTTQHHTAPYCTILHHTALYCTFTALLRFSAGGGDLDTLRWWTHVGTWSAPHVCLW
jgi:hypothetical protein